MDIKKTKSFVLISVTLATLGLLYFIMITYFDLEPAYTESTNIETSLKKLNQLQKINDKFCNLCFCNNYSQNLKNWDLQFILKLLHRSNKYRQVSL